jgi:hypothetical protein
MSSISRYRITDHPLQRHGSGVIDPSRISRGFKKTQPAGEDANLQPPDPKFAQGAFRPTPRGSNFARYGSPPGRTSSQICRPRQSLSLLHQRLVLAAVLSELSSTSRSGSSSRSLRTICSGVWRLPFGQVTACPHRGRREAHRWRTDFRRSGQIASATRRHRRQWCRSGRGAR